jgi:predicted SAM-dependent methyltransferase
MNVIEYGGVHYPALQAEGNAAQWCMPFAKKMLEGRTRGMDIGCCKPEWAYPGAVPVDIEFDDEYHATCLPMDDAEYIFSSHCLEHVPNWVEVLNCWHDHLELEGILFLYLPHYHQRYWRPWNNRNHVNVLSPELLNDYFESGGWCNWYVTEGYDLNDSFYAVAQKT